MSQEQRGPHPCTRFQNGEVKTFAEAMNVLVEQQRYEEQSLAQYEGVTAKERLDARAAVKEVEVAVQIATRFYERYVLSAHTVAAEHLRACGNPLLDTIAQALESGDYSGLSL
jgi:hypothetical protein